MTEFQPRHIQGMGRN